MQVLWKASCKSKTLKPFALPLKLHQGAADPQNVLKRWGYQAALTVLVMPAP